MGRLIDADKIIFREIDEIGGEYEPYLGCSKEQIDKLPTVDAIPKAEYEIRLKADLKAILVDLQLEIEELNMHGFIQLQSYRQKTGRYRQGFERAQNLSTKIIQQKINELRGAENES